MLQATERSGSNGRLIPWDDAKIHVLAHVVSYGSQFFEGIRCYDTEQGSAIFRRGGRMLGASWIPPKSTAWICHNLSTN